MLMGGLAMAGCQPPSDDEATRTTSGASAGSEHVGPLAEQRPQVVPAPWGNRDDPWYWLRDDSRSDRDVLAYLEAENAYQDRHMAPLEPLRLQLQAEMRARVGEDQRSVPYFDRGYWYYQRFEPGLEYPIIARRQHDLDAPEQLMLDLNEKARAHAYYRIGGQDVSPGGRRLAWLEDTVGRFQYRIRIKDLDSGEILDTGIEGVSSLAWAGDDRHLFYVANAPETLRSWQLWRLDTANLDAAPVLIYQEDDAAYYSFVSRSRSNDWLLLTLSSTAAREVRTLPAAQPAGDWVVFLPRERGHVYQVDHLADRWIVRTNFEAPDFRIVSVDLDRHADRSAWVDIIPASDTVHIEAFATTGEFLAVAERSGGLPRIRVHRWHDGSEDWLTFEEPAHAVWLGVQLDQTSTRLRYHYSSMTTPTQTWAMDVVSGEHERLDQETVGGGFSSANYRTARVWVTARDGARIPVSLLYHRDTARDGSAPLYLFGHGAYGINIDPMFASARLSLVDRGFVFAIAHVRGGQEMGRAWYEQGRLLNKRNSFYDFIDVTRHLVADGWADSDRVFAAGASAGGLLIAAVANMAPSLYRGMVAHVPFVDVLTSMLDESIPLVSNEFDEWGNPADQVHYDYLLSYSPYDNVAAQDYPALLVTAALWDSQVPYWEPAKWVARLRASRTDTNPLLLSTSMAAGHAGASGRFQRLGLVAMEYAFILDLAGFSAGDRE